MNIQTAFIYCLLTVVIIYSALYGDCKLFPKDTKEERVFRTSLLCGLINWIVIVYFLYKAEVTMPTFAQAQQIIMNDKF